MDGGGLERGILAPESSVANGEELGEMEKFSS